MNKPQLLGTAVFSLLISSVAGSAAAYTFDTFNSPALNVVSSLNELQDSGTVTSGSTTYDSITGTGDFDLSADVLKIGHHGSKYSSLQGFIAAVTPKYGVIQVGENNYGHPSLRILKRLEYNNIEILRTDEKGTIIFVSDGDQIWQKS